jgi:hypothetical protein
MNKPTFPWASSSYRSYCINYTTLAPGFYGRLSCVTPYYSLMGQAVHMPSHSVQRIMQNDMVKLVAS